VPSLTAPADLFEDLGGGLAIAKLVPSSGERLLFHQDFETIVGFHGSDLLRDVDFTA